MLFCAFDRPRRIRMAFHGATRWQSRYGQGPSTTQRWKQHCKRRRRRPLPPSRPNPAGIEQEQSSIALKDAPPLATILQVTCQRLRRFWLAAGIQNPHLFTSANADSTVHCRSSYSRLLSATPPTHHTNTANERSLAKRDPLQFTPPRPSEANSFVNPLASQE